MLCNRGGKTLTSDDSTYTHSVWLTSTYNHVRSSDSVRKCFDFFFFFTSEPISKLKIGYYRNLWDLEASLKQTFRWAALMQESIFLLTFYVLPWFIFFFFFLIRSCPFELTPLLSSLQIRSSSADLALWPAPCLCIDPYVNDSGLSSSLWQINRVSNNSKANTLFKKRMRLEYLYWRGVRGWKP